LQRRTYCPHYHGVALRLIRTFNHLPASCHHRHQDCVLAALSISTVQRHTASPLTCNICNEGQSTHRDRVAPKFIDPPSFNSSQQTSGTNTYNPFDLQHLQRRPECVQKHTVAEKFAHPPSPFISSQHTLRTSTCISIISCVPINQHCAKTDSNSTDLQHLQRRPEYVQRQSRTRIHPSTFFIQFVTTYIENE